VKLPAGVPNTMQYDGDGKLVQKQDSTGLANYVSDERNILQEADQSNLTQVTYTLGPAYYGDLVSQRRASATSYYAFDGLGSTDRLSSTSGVLLNQYVYRAFGQSQFASETASNSLKYVGRQGYLALPDLTQYFARARYFTPLAARWLSYDPIGLAGQDFNTFRYVSNNPINLTDPSGTIKVRQIKKTRGVGGLGGALESRVKCGEKVIVNWQYVLRWPAPCEGYLVQKIDFYAEFNKRCTNCPSEPPTKTPLVSFWEATPLDEGDQSVDDDSETPFRDQTCGGIRDEVEIKYYCRNAKNIGATGGVGTGFLEKLGWRKRKFEIGDFNIVAALTFVGKAPPPFWAQTPVEGPAKRFFTGWWNCCVNTKEKDAWATAWEISG
jgi:RHS repeat-associated protein